MQCYICGGEMSQVKKDVKTTWKGITNVFPGMKAWLCLSCGEEAYEPDDVQLMQELIRGSCMICVLCGAVGTGFLVAHGKAVCPDCFTLLYVQSAERLSRIQEGLWLGADRLAGAS